MDVRVIHDASPRLEGLILALVRAMEAIAPGLAADVLSAEAPPPVRPPTCDTRGGAPPGRRPRRHCSPEEAAAALEEKRARDAERKRRTRAQKKEEQGASPTPRIVDSPESPTYSDSQTYTTPAATSSTLAPTALVDSPECVRGHTQHVRGQWADVRGQSVDRGGIGGEAFEVSSVVVASFTPKALQQQELPGVSADNVSTDRPKMSADVPPRTAPRALAAHRVTAPKGSRDGESALTPEGSVAPGHSLRDAMCALYADVFPGRRYDWRDEDDRATRGLLVRASSDTDEVLLRWRIALGTRFPRCRSVRKLLADWNEYGAPDLAPDTPQQEPTTQHSVGRSDAQGCACAVHGCGDSTRTGPTLGQPLCAFHALAMLDALGQSANHEAAAAWLEGQNAEEVAP